MSAMHNKNYSGALLLTIECLRIIRFAKPDLVVNWRLRANTMMQKRVFFTLVTILLTSFTLFAQKQRLKNIPYIDHRRLHYGFSLGINMTDVNFAHNGTDWYAESPSANPAFCVGLMGDLALTEHLSLRCAPTLYFQSREITFRNVTDQQTVKQTLKTSYIELPFSLKIATRRLNNYRPYILGGVSAYYDMTHENEEPIVFNRFDIGLHIAIGCDTYLPFFKFCPELRFNIGLLDMLDHNRKDLKDPTLMQYTDAIKSARNKGVSLVFYFE